MRFKEVIGQQKIKKKLIETVKNGRISHAQLFVGSEGVGTLPMVLAYAQYISCIKKEADDSCGTCSSCVKYQNLAHPDLHFIYPVATNKMVKTKPKSADFLPFWRTAVITQPYLSLMDWYAAIEIENKQGAISTEESQSILRTLSLKAYESPYKIVIIWMAEKMNIAAANKLLKIIEEPPEKTLFFLISEHQEQILPTILSRTQLIQLHKIDDSDIAARLSEIGTNKADADAAIAISNGNFKAVTVQLNNSETLDYNRTTFIDWMRLCYMKDVKAIIDWSEKISPIGRESQKAFFVYGIRIIRECLMMNYAGNDLNKLAANETQFVQKFSPFIHGNNGILMIEQIDTACYHIERNANPKILFLDLSLKMIKLLRPTAR